MTYNRFIQGLKAAGVEVDRRCWPSWRSTTRPPSPRWSRSPKAAAAAADVNAAGGLTALAGPRPAPTRRRARSPAIRSPRGHGGRAGLAKRAACRRSERRQFLAEGPQAVREALACGAALGVVRELFVTAAARRRHPDLAGPAARPGAGVARGRAARCSPRWPRPSPRRAHRRLPAPSTSRSTSVLAAGAAAGRRPARGPRPGQRRHRAAQADAAGADAVVLQPTPRRPLQPQDRPRLAPASLFHLPVVVGAPRRRTRWRALRGRGPARARRRRRRASTSSTSRRRRRCSAGRTAWLFGNEAWGLPTTTARWPTHAWRCRSTAGRRA